jgi:hypothetical protein
MNLKRILFSCLILFQVINLFCQRIEYTYDENGNRTNRTIVVERLNSNSVQFPVINPKSLKSHEYSTGTIANPSSQGVESQSDKKMRNEEDISKERLKIDSETEGIVTVVYPNPNKGILKIDISNLPAFSRTDMRLYDLSGMQLTSKRNFENHSEIDISQFKDGIYILRIKINDRVFDWKVIKNSD